MLKAERQSHKIIHCLWSPVIFNNCSQIEKKLDIFPNKPALLLFARTCRSYNKTTSYTVCIKLYLISQQIQCHVFPFINTALVLVSIKFWIKKSNQQKSNFV